MKSINNKYILIAIIGLLAGFGIAYLIFGGEESPVKENAVEMEDIDHANDHEIWTCSMHPQIRQNEPGDCPICGMDLIPVEETNSDDPLVLEMTEAAVKLSNIQTTKLHAVSAGETKTLNLSGKVRADERLRSSQVTHVAGRIEKLYVNFTGEQISKGQKIAEIYAPELISAQRELLEAKLVQDINPTLLKVARKKLEYLKISPSMIQKIEEEGEIIERFPLWADHTGIVTERKVSSGDYVRQGDVLYDVVDLSRIWVVFDAFENDLPFIRKGDEVRFTTPALPSREFNAKVDFIQPTLDSDKRSVSIRLEMSNPRGVLKPEMLAYGKLTHTTAEKTGVKVPKSAVLWTGVRSVVYVKVPEREVPAFEFREITLGESLGDSYVVMEGLQEGEEVVTHGNFVIDAAAQLNNQTSMMNRGLESELRASEKQLPDFRDSSSPGFKKQLAAVTASYLALKDAFVDTDPKGASSAVSMVLEKIREVDASLLSAREMSFWEEKENALIDHGKQIMDLNDIGEQRKAFDFFSSALIESIRVFGQSGRQVYVQHCPMAIGKKGADWISEDIQIRNPYFGDAMLKCGSVRDTLFLSQ